jgi:1-acyl-sn-glycerol-3-phosphate acyltransferase
VAKVTTKLAGSSLTNRFLYFVVRNLLWVLMLVWLRVRVTGRHNVPQSGAFILAPIHRSAVDIPLASLAVHRRVRFMGKDSLWSKRPVAAVLSALGGFPVTRGSADLEALKRCIGVLERGEPLVMFPEGTRQTGALVHPLFDGPAYVALKTGVPVVPVGIGGSERVMSKGSRSIRAQRCRVVVGAPIFPPVTGGKAPRELVSQLTAELATSLQRVFDQARRDARLTD